MIDDTIKSILESQEVDNYDDDIIDDDNLDDDDDIEIDEEYGEDTERDDQGDGEY